MNQHDPVKIIEQYCDDVLSGKIPVNELARLAVQRHVDDLKTAEERGFYFCESSARHICQFFDFLDHSKGEWAGTPIKLEPWQCFNLGVAFGWRRLSDGFRRFRTAWNELPRKNAKSTMASGVGNYLFFADGEPGAEVYSAATKKDQAKIIHTDAIRQVRASPALRSRITVYRESLTIESTNSRFLPLGADEDTLDGLNVHGALIDELHKHKTAGVVDVLDTATGSRRQPMIWMTTTAGSDRTSVCWDYHEYGEKVVRGIIQDDTFFCLIFCADPDDDPFAELTWRKANPNYGISVKPDDLKRKAEKARKQPSYLNTFLRLHLNRWTEQAERWLDMEKWMSCKEPVNLEDLKGQDCYLGMDLSTTTDLTSFTLLFFGDRYYEAVPFFFCPEDTIKDRTQQEGDLYQTWVNSGHLIATEGNVIDYSFIEQKIIDLDKAGYNIKQINYDPAHATQFALRLKALGFEVVPYRQSFLAMNQACKELERLYLNRKIRHGNHPVLNWNAGNVAVERDSQENIRPKKAKSTGRIDGIVALLIALGAYIMEEKPKKSVYETRGLVST